MSSFSGQKAGDPYGKVLVFRKVAGERGCGEPALSHPPSGGGGGRAPVRINPASAPSGTDIGSFDSISHAGVGVVHVYYAPFCVSETFRPHSDKWQEHVQVAKSLPAPVSALGETLMLTLQGTGFGKISFEATCGPA